MLCFSTAIQVVTLDKSKAILVFTWWQLLINLHANTTLNIRHKIINCTCVSPRVKSALPCALGRRPHLEFIGRMSNELRPSLLFSPYNNHSYKVVIYYEDIRYMSISKQKVNITSTMRLRRRLEETSLKTSFTSTSVNNCIGQHHHNKHQVHGKLPYNL